MEAYCRRNGLWLDPDARPRYTRTVDIDLAAIGMQIAGRVEEAGPAADSDYLAGAS